MQGQGLMIVIDVLGIELDVLKREVLRLRSEVERLKTEGGIACESDDDTAVTRR